MPSSQFPAPGDFNGYYEPQPAPVTVGGQSTYTGFLVVSMIDRQLVEAMLPAGLALATSNTGLVQHPVIHLVGHQRVLLDLLPQGIQVPSGLTDYQEMILLVPFVEYNGTWHNFAARMYLDNNAAVYGGNLGYAYAKVLGDLVENASGPETTTQVNVTGSPYFFSDVVRTGSWLTAAQASATFPRWTDLNEYMAMPILGWDNLGLGGSLRVMCSYFEWDFTNATFAAAQSKHRFEDDFRPPYMAPWVALGDLSNAVDGAIAVRDVRWRIIHPPAPSC
jgi:hypothetical protein